MLNIWYISFKDFKNDWINVIADISTKVTLHKLPVYTVSGIRGSIRFTGIIRFLVETQQCLASTLWAQGNSHTNASAVHSLYIESYCNSSYFFEWWIRYKEMDSLKENFLNCPCQLKIASNISRVEHAALSVILCFLFYSATVFSEVLSSVSDSNHNSWPRDVYFCEIP